MIINVITYNLIVVILRKRKKKNLILVHFLHFQDVILLSGTI